MDLTQRLTLFLVALFVLQLCSVANANLAFPVERKFKGPIQNLAALKDHDALRRGRFLSAVDVPLGGNGRANSNGSVFFPSSLFSLSFVFHMQSFSFLFSIMCGLCVACFEGCHHFLFGCLILLV